MNTNLAYSKSIRASKLTGNPQVWRPNLMYFTLYFEYLRNRYGSTLMTLSDHFLQINSKRLTISYSKFKPIDPYLTVLDLHSSESVISREFSNSTARFYILPVVIAWARTGADAGSHQNVLVIDKLRKECEIFEPYGDINKVVSKEVFNAQEYLLLIKQLMNHLNRRGKMYKVFSPTDFLPPIGMQLLYERYCTNEKIYTEIGFCMVWTMWFIEQRLKYPGKNRKFIIKYITSRVKSGELIEYICKIPQNYALFIDKLYRSKSLLSRLVYRFGHLYKLYFKLLT